MACYKARGWTLFGATQGYRRSREDFYRPHARPKLWVRELPPGARTQLGGQPHRRRAPGETTFFRLLSNLNRRSLEPALLEWQNHVLGRRDRTERAGAVGAKELLNGFREDYFALAAQTLFCNSLPVMQTMSESNSPGGRLRRAVAQERPLQVAGAVSAYAARLAEASGFQALYVSGGGVAASSCGIPDLGITTMDDVLTDVRRITDITALPVLVDMDTGWGGAFNIARAIKSLIKAGAAGAHIEDQVQQKRCGHRPGKAIVSADEMVDRVKAAVDAKSDPQFVVMARTDALAVEGMSAAIDRAGRCVAAGADMIFPEAMTTLEQYRQFVDAVKVPVLANITEFGATPLFSVEELRAAGVGLVLFPLSAFRAMSAAALKVNEAIRLDGTQKNVIADMQTRADLYRYLDYHAFEQKLDELFARKEI